MNLGIETITAGLLCGEKGCRCQRALAKGSIITHCPGHDDRHPSLSVKEDNGKLLIHCFAGCDQRQVITALKARGLWVASEQQKTRRGQMDQPVTVDALARAKGLLAEFLHGSGFMTCPGKGWAFPTLMVRARLCRNSGLSSGTFTERPQIAYT